MNHYDPKSDIDAVLNLMGWLSFVCVVAGIAFLAAIATVNDRVSKLEEKHKPAVCEACGK
jgi:hypothetical protein